MLAGVFIWSGFVGFWTSLWSSVSAAQATLVQTVVLIGGGGWAFVLYLRRREGQPTVRIEHECRVLGGGSLQVLVVQVHLTNTSAVLIKRASGVVTAFDASEIQPEGVVLREWKSQDFISQAQGELQASEAGTTFKAVTDALLEPNECVSSEVSFVMADPPSLLGLRVTVKSRWAWYKILWGHLRHPLLYRSSWARHWSWGSFAYIDLLRYAGENVAAGKTARHP